ncbi:hypothetical protein D9M68_996200 [compost metagenome]
MPGGMAPELGVLAVPHAQGPGALRLLLSESITEHIEKGVGVGGGQGIDKFVTVFNEPGVMVVRIGFQ